MVKVAKMGDRYDFWRKPTEKQITRSEYKEYLGGKENFRPIYA